MRQRFYSKKEPWLGIIFFLAMIVPLLSAIVPFYFKSQRPPSNGEMAFTFIISGGLSLLLLSFWFQTYYEIENGFLYYRMGPFKGKIMVSSIKSIKKKAKKALYSPSLSTDLMSIQYNKYDEITISPEDKEAFIGLLRIINPGIVVED